MVDIASYNSPPGIYSGLNMCAGCITQFAMTLASPRLWDLESLNHGTFTAERMFPVFQAASDITPGWRAIRWWPRARCSCSLTASPPCTRALKVGSRHVTSPVGSHIFPKSFSYSFASAFPLYLILFSLVGSHL